MPDESIASAGLLEALWQARVALGQTARSAEDWRLIGSALGEIDRALAQLDPASAIGASLTLPPVSPPSGTSAEDLHREIERLRMSAGRQHGLFEQVLAQSPQGIIVSDAEGKLILQNQAAERIWAGSATVETVAEWGQYRAFHPDGRPYAPDDWSMARCLRLGETTAAEEIHFQRFDGTHGVMLGSSAPLTNSAGDLLGAVSIFADITHFKQAQQELERAHEAAARLLADRDQALAEAAEAQHQLAFVAEASRRLAESLDYETTLANVADLIVPTLADWCTVYLLGPNEVARPVAVVHRDLAKQALLRAMRQRYSVGSRVPFLAGRVLRTGRAEVFPEVTESVLAIIVQDENHRRMIAELGLASYLLVPLVAHGTTIGLITLGIDEPGRPYTPDTLAVAEELARRCALAIDNARLYQEAQERLQARDDFLTSASHDLKSPLTAIKGYTQLLERQIRRTKPTGAERFHQSVEQIDLAAARLTDQIDELLDVAQLRTGGQLDLNRRSLDLVELVSRSVAGFQSSADHHQFCFVADPSAIVGWWDAVRLGRVIDNLLSNAVKFSPDGGEITIQVEQTGDGAAKLTVQDQGVGIPEADLPRIFERYRRGSNVAGRIAGRGIGLAGVRQIVEQHGGSVSLTSQVGVGTIVSIQLPLAEPTAE